MFATKPLENSENAAFRSYPRDNILSLQDCFAKYKMFTKTPETSRFWGFYFFVCIWVLQSILHIERKNTIIIHVVTECNEGRPHEDRKNFFGV